MMQLKQYTMEDMREVVTKELENDKELKISNVGNDSLKVEMKGDDKFSSVICLSNLLREVNNGSEIKPTIKMFLEPFKALKNAKELEEKISNWDYVKDKIIFVPQRKDYGSKGEVEGVDVEMKDQFFKKPFINDITLIGVIDYPGYMMYIPKERIKKWGKTDAEVEDQMGKNLIVHETNYRTDSIGGVLHIRSTGGGVLSTFLIQPKKLRNIADENGFKGKELVGTMPFRDLIMISDSSMDNIMKLWGTAQSMIADKFMSYPISDKPFMIDKDGVVCQIRNDEMPGSGVMVSIDPLSGRMSALPIGTTNNPPELPMPPEELFNKILQKDDKLKASLAAMRMMTAGILVEDFVDFLKKQGESNEEIKHIVKELVENKMLEPKKVNNEWRLIPNKNIVKRFLGKRFGKEDSEED